MQLQSPDSPAATPASAPARHAQVVPSFVVSAVSRTLVYRAGDIAPGELVRWERPAELTESARQDLRNQIIKRLRTRSDWLWSQTIGVRLVNGWRDRLVGSDARGVSAVLALRPERPLESLTLREFRTGFGAPLERVLAVLARLESVYWTPPPRASQRLRTVVPAQTLPPVPAHELHEVAQRVLALPWLNRVSQQDLRFAYPGPGSLPDWISEQLAGADVPHPTVDLLRRLDEAGKLTAAEEALALTLAAGAECLPRMNPEAASRWPVIFMTRHISAQGAGRTLVEVGQEYGLTRERIRQICEAFEEVFQRSPVATPALTRLLAAAARIAPCSVDEVNEQLARFIGAGAGIECLVPWAKTLGQEQPGVRCQRVRMRVRGQPVDTTVIERTEEASWVTPLIRHVSRDAHMFGCTNILRVAGLLALKEGVAPGQEAIEAALEGSSVFRWLDKETGWFTLGDNKGCSVATRVRKIMAVAQDHVGADEIAAALASDDILIYRETQSLGLATPPVHVLRELFRGWDWLKVVQKGRFTAGEAINVTEVLSEPEQLAVKVITLHDGVACRFELRDAIGAELGPSSVAVSMMLGSSPIFDRLEHGLYRLIGRRVGDYAVNAARARMRANSAKHAGAASVVDAKPNEFVFRITESSLRNEQYSVPSRFHPRLAGQRVGVGSAEGIALGEARISPTGVLRGINQLFEGAKAGDLFRVEVVEDALLVQHVPEAPVEGRAGE